MRRAVVIEPDALAMEAWDDKSRGSVLWKTLISSDRTESESLVCGLAYFGPGEMLAEHRHLQPEIIHVVKGSGSARLGREETPLSTGTTVFIPSDMEHRFVAGEDGLSLFYTFAVSSFAEIEYRFSAPKGKPPPGRLP